MTEEDRGDGGKGRDTAPAVNRRRLLTAFSAATGATTSIVLPAKWTRPLVHSVVTPAHAAGSSSTTPVVTTASDMRLKRDIVLIVRLGNGVGLYRYRYWWSAQVYVGVMAQEVAAIVPEAVRRGADGYLRVDYARLGLTLHTWDEWQALCRRRGLPVAAGVTARTAA